MDPYLEDPAVFPDLHDRLIAYLSETLNSQLPPPYYTGMASRVWVETSHRRIGPDVVVLPPTSQRNDASPQSPSGGGVAIAAAVATEPVVVHVPHDETRETLVEIFADPGGERLVTTLEILSLSNKTPGEQGRDLYLQKQGEVLRSKVHLVEIDLLRAGKHTTAVPLDLSLPCTGPFDYHVCIHRYDQWEDYSVYPIRLSHCLPTISVPLLPGDQPVRVDLQALLGRCYDVGQYRRRVRYRDRTPVQPLSPEQVQWAEQVLRQYGLSETPPAPAT